MAYGPGTAEIWDVPHTETKSPSNWCEASEATPGVEG